MRITTLQPRVLQRFFAVPWLLHDYFPGFINTEDGMLTESVDVEPRMGKAAGTLRTILLPSVVAVVGAILAGTLFFSAYSQSTFRRDSDRRATTAHTVLAVTRLQQLAMHQAVGAWHEALGRRAGRPASEAQAMFKQVDLLDTELRKLGPTGIKTEPIHVALDAFRTSQTPFGRYNAMVAVIEGLKSFSLELSQGSDADNVHFGDIQLADLQKVVRAIPMFFDLGTLVPAVRAGTGVDPTPTDSRAMALVEDLTHSSLNQSGISRNPRQFVDLGDGKIATQIYVDVLLGGGAVLSREAIWVDGDRSPTFQHASFPELARSTHAVIDNTAKTVSGYLTTLESGYGSKARDYSQRQRRQLAGGFLSISISAFGVLWLTRRVSSRMRSLRRVSERDSLTSLLNRDGLRSAVTPWFVSGKSAIGVAVVDLDHFKQINDQYGHGPGDQLLIGVGRRVRTQVVASTTAVARWGGDEFVIVFRLEPGPAFADLSAILRRISRAMAEPFDLGETIVASSASIGAAVCESGKCNFDDLFRSGDHTLYEVKRAGRNNFALSACSCSRPTDSDAPATTNALNAINMPFINAAIPAAQE